MNRRPLIWHLIWDALRRGGREFRSYVNYRWVNLVLATQIKAMRKQRGWSQSELAKRAGLTVMTIVRIEKLYWDKTGFNLSTIGKLGTAFDVAVIVRFRAFSEMVDEMTQTPYVDNGLSESFYNIPTFEEERQAIAADLNSKEVGR